MIVQGQDWQWQVALENPDGTAMDLTGMSFACQIRASTHATTIAFTPAIAIASNVVTLSIANATTTMQGQSLQLKYDFWQVDSSGTRQPLLYGNVEFQAAVTR